MKKKATLIVVCAAVVLGLVAICGKRPKPPTTMDEALEIARSAGFVHSSGHSLAVTVSVDPVEAELRLDSPIGWKDVVRIYARHSDLPNVPGMAYTEWGPLSLYGDEAAVKKLVDATPRAWFP